VDIIRYVIYTSIVIAICAICLSCSGTAVESSKVFSGSGVVKQFDGFCGIVTDEGYKLEPHRGLPEEFEVDGLRVEFRVETKSDVATGNMWGIPVEILGIRVIEPITVG